MYTCIHSQKELHTCRHTHTQAHAHIHIYIIIIIIIIITILVKFFGDANVLHFCQEIV